MHGFTTVAIDLGSRPEDAFERQSASVRLEPVTGGREGVHLTKPGPRGVPLVRTTTRYVQPPQLFGPTHDAIIDEVHRAAPSCGSSFNHALVELYEPQYRKMGYHSDQALDLDADSSIAIVSCYDREVGPMTPGVRQLMVKSKTTEDRFTLPMPHGSVLLFSVATNARFAHKIVLPTATPDAPRWLGFTLRCASTFVHFREGTPHFEDGPPLTLADAEQRKTFFRLRGAENRTTEFRYPRLRYTLSDSDLLPPE